MDSGHAALPDEAAPGFLAIGHSRELQEFGINQGVHGNFQVPSAQSGGKLGRKDAGIGAGEVDVDIAAVEERGRTALPVFDVLDFVDHDHMGGGFSMKFLDGRVMQIFSRADGIPFHRFFVDFEDRCLRVFCEEVSGMGFEEGALADAAHAGEDLDQWLEGVGFELLEIKISTMHEEMLISKKLSIVNLFLRCAERAPLESRAGAVGGDGGPVGRNVSRGESGVVPPQSEIGGGTCFEFRDGAGGF